MKKRKLYSLMLALSMAMTSVPAAAVAAEGISTAANAAVTSWVDMYRNLGVDAQAGAGLYDTVSSATQFTSYHAKDIPAVVSRVTDADGKTTGLDGVVLTGAEAKQDVKLASAGYEYSSRYGFGEFFVVPDDTVEGYVWNDYIANLYAVTISDGKTTAGTMPWIDYYGEAATAGPHYNKVQIALNSGEALASNKAEVHRFDAMIGEDGYLNPGKYTVTLYAEGFKTLTVENIEVKKVAGVELSAADVASGAKMVSVDGMDRLPSDFDAEYRLDGEVQSRDAGSISLPAGMAVGTHTLTVSDKSGKYADLSCSFLCTTDQLMAKYDAAAHALVKADNVSDEAWTAYLAAIATVNVNGADYAAKGRGAVKIVGEDGVIDLDAVYNEAPVFTDNAVNQVTVTATAYTTNVTMEVQKGTVAAPEKKTQSMSVKASKTSIKGADIAKKKQTVTLTAKNTCGKVSYKVSNSTYMTVKNNVVTFKKGTPAGTYKVTVKAAGNEEYKAASKTVTIKVVKSSQPMKVNVSSKAYKAATVKQKAQTFTIKATNAEGKVTYKSNSKNITVTSKGKVTVKKGTAKGTYKVTVTAAGNKNFKKGTKTVTIKVK